MRGVEQSFGRLEREMAEERAAALVRIASRLEALLAEHERQRAGLSALTGDARRQRLAACDALRREAQLYRWYLVVQREAVGLFHHADVDHFYPVPTEER